jgi:hypothetical protein
MGTIRDTYGSESGNGAASFGSDNALGLKVVENIETLRLQLGALIRFSGALIFFRTSLNSRIGGFELRTHRTGLGSVS